MNVIGSRPDGWWKDRDAAVRELVEVLRRFAESSGDDVTVVFDHRPHGMGVGRLGKVAVAFATGPGPNAADRSIVRRVERDPNPTSLVVVTSDRQLAEKVRKLGVDVEPAGRFRDRLERT